MYSGMKNYIVVICVFAKLGNTLASVGATLHSERL